MRVASEAVARQAGIENGDLAARTAELQGAGETGKTAADDDDVIHGDWLRVVDGGLGWAWRVGLGLARNCSSRGADYLSNAAHEIVVCAACIPSAAQSAERGDGGARSLGLCLCLRVLYLQQVAVRV